MFFPKCFLKNGSDKNVFKNKSREKNPNLQFGPIFKYLQNIFAK
jgi:hypothetical protein